LPFVTIAQEQGQYKFTFAGFVRADALFDTRQTVEAREGYLLFYPRKPLFDSEGKDINALPAFNQYSMTTRLSAKVNGPDLLGAKAFAFVESDFTGASNAENNSLRLRHAYMSLQWKNTRLIMGQYWHPQDIPEMIPNVLGLNTGAPFHSFSRQPQIRVDQKLGKLNLVGVVASQRDYVNKGPVGNSYEYMRNSAVPNLHSQIQFKASKLFAGAGIDYKRLKPRMVTDSGFISNELVNCFSYTGFLKADISNFTVKAQYTLNRALNDHLMMGGFGVTTTDTLTDRREYAPLTYHSVWLNINYVKGNWQPSLFAGYTSNITDDEKFTGPVYARDADIEYVYRIAPMLTFIQNKFNFIVELEYTVAKWQMDETSLMLMKNRDTGVLRAGIGAIYSF
jgi:hypothetical protein